MSTKVKQLIVIYEVTNRTTGEKSYQPATNYEDACKQAGWLVKDCFIIEASKRYKPVPDHSPLILVRLPCEVCPFQWAECRKTPAQNCPCQREMPDLTQWLGQATKAHLCELVGKDLTRADYRLHQKWVSIAEAIKELSPQH